MISSHSQFMTNDTSHFFKSLSNGEDQVLITDLFALLDKNGIDQTDLRVSNAVKRLFGHLKRGHSLAQEDFTKILGNSVVTFLRATQNKFIIPKFETFREQIEEIYTEVSKNKSGHNATYIPQLARVDPDLFGVSFCSTDGQVCSFGDSSYDFCIQSISKTINYCIALELHGESKVHAHVGREPSGIRFNEIRLNDNNLPHNPMINAGAIMTCSLIKPELDLSDRFEYVTDIWRSVSCNSHISFANSVYHSEKASANRNYALAHFMQEVKAFPKNTNIENVLDFYFQCCSIQSNTEGLSRVAATLANGGICPFSGQQVFSSDTVKNCLSMMYSCGMYDFSGEYAFSVGLPAKSGVAGGMIIVIPNVGGFALFAPPLDKSGNPCKGVQFSQEIVKRFNFHTYDCVTRLPHKIDPTENSDTQIADSIFQIIYFAACGDIASVRSLLLSGIDINQADYDKRTPLHLAVDEKQHEMIKYLVSQGADPSLKDRWGSSPLDAAKNLKDETAISLLSNK